MKKCPYCGKEYIDNVERCLIDNELLLGGEAKPSPEAEQVAVTTLPTISAAESLASPPTAVWTERQLLIFEVVLVCAIAFGGNILASFHSFLGNSSGSSDEGTYYKWIYAIFRQGSVLGLLWYVLKRRDKTFLNLGLVWAWKDVGWAIILGTVARYIFHGVYNGFYAAGLTSISQASASDHVGYILFGGGITFATILFQFLNPFFEELIVRAYVMTEVKALTNSATKAIIISTVLQTSYHFYQGAPAAFADGAMFLLFSIFYAKTNRIAPIILAHLYADVHGTLWYLFNH